MELKPDKLGEKYLNLSPTQKKVVVYTILGIFVMLLVWMVYSGKKEKQQMAPPEEVKFEEVVPEVRLLSKSLYEETTQKTRKLEQSLKDIEEKIKEIQASVEKAKREQNDKLTLQLKEIQKKLEQDFAYKQRELMGKVQEGLSAVEEKAESSQSTGDRKIYTYQPSNVPPPPQINNDKTMAPQFFGGIYKIKLDKTDSAITKQLTKNKQDEELKVYLPPCFVPGTLLTGISAFTSMEGKQEPVRALIRLRDLAVLPNEVKADLKGCFVVGEAYGNLADEKVHVRLLRLSCVARDGTSIIDESVTGWVTDGDSGETGLKGRVVSKFGSLLARSAIAGLLQGFGDAYSNSQSNIIYSDSGNFVQLPSPDDALKAGVGKGISTAAKGLGDFYLQLAKQTLPVIEVGTGKKVTVVFDKGVELTIKNFCLEGENRCKTTPTQTKSDGLGILNLIG